jgi:hypothetical protein
MSRHRRPQLTALLAVAAALTIATAPVAPAQPAPARSPNARPVLAQPSNAQPALAQPALTQPVFAQPALTPPATAQPLTTQPSPTQPSTAQPSTNQLSTDQLSTDEPGSNQPDGASPAPVDECVLRDSRLSELSGLAADAQFRYAVSDGGSRLQVLVLRRDCTVARVITAAVDPFDVEDLALAPDGNLWLADIGDNDRKRGTVAVHVLPQNGPPELHRMTYPDGPHDAEALLLDRLGVPYIVTKEAFGGAGVYRPSGPLTTPGPIPLELVTSVRFDRTDTPGGPVGTLGSTLITGGATSTDGTVVALRTYTDAYVFPVHDGDLVAALGGKPVRVPLPGEPQGEAIAFEPDGTLLSGSERAGSGPQPLRAVPGAAALVTSTEASPSASPPSAGQRATPSAGQPTRGPLSDWQAILISVLGAALVIYLVLRFTRRRSA